MTFTQDSADVMY